MKTKAKYGQQCPEWEWMKAEWNDGSGRKEILSAVPGVGVEKKRKAESNDDSGRIEIQSAVPGVGVEKKWKAESNDDSDKRNIISSARSESGVHL